VHRNEKHFREPERFLPERWTPELEAALPRWAYLPFGGGPRVCIGSHFALLESVIALSEIHRRVRLEFVPNRLPPLLASITVRPNGPVPARIERRAEE
jgi:cytochrome P450